MSDSSFDTPNPEFRAINSVHGDDRPSYYKKGRLYVQVFPQDKEGIVLTPEESNRCLKKIAEGSSVERATEAVILQKAGEIKYQNLKKSNKLPPAPGRVKQHQAATPKGATPQQTSSATSSTVTTASSSYAAAQPPAHCVEYYKEHFKLTEDGICRIKVSAKEAAKVILNAQEKQTAAGIYQHLSPSEAEEEYQREKAKLHKFHLLKVLGLLPEQVRFIDCVGVSQVESEEEDFNSSSSAEEDEPVFTPPRKIKPDPVIMTTVPASITRRIATLETRLAAIQAKLDGDATTPLTVEEITVLATKIETAIRDHSTIFGQLYDLDDAINITAVAPKDGIIEAAIDNANLDCLKIKKKHQQADRQGRQSQPGASSSKVHLPKITLPKFDGQWRNWIGFKDLFKTTVLDQDDADLPKVQKFHLLKTSLEEEPLRTIKSIPMTGLNLDRAWKALCEKYDNDRKLTEDYLQELDNLKHISDHNAHQLRKLFDTVNDAREALRVLGHDVDQWDPILISKVTRCFDLDTRSLYELMVGAELSKNPTLKIEWKQLTDFIQMRAMTLENSRTSSSKHQHEPKKHEQKRSATFHTKTNTCVFCKKDHYMTSCTDFKSASLEQRREMVREKKLCFNCLNPSHRSFDCKSERTCRTCGKKHHTLLHLESKKNQTSSSGKSSSKEEQTQSNHAKKCFSTVILPTAKVMVQDCNEELVPYRAMLDSGSQSTFISEKAVQYLGRKRQPCSVGITGIGDEDNCTTKGYVDLHISSLMDPEFRMKVPALILPTVTGLTPSAAIKYKQWDHIKDIYLADSTFFKPGDVDILLGADVTWRVLKDAKKLGKPTEPVARLTTFGWVISGNALDSPSKLRVKSHVATADQLLGTMLQQFWRVEEPPEKKHLTPEQEKCEKIFEETTTRGPDGKFCVKFPFKEDIPKLGKSKAIALKRLSGVEARLSRQPELRPQYEEFMDDYEKQGHMEEVPVPDDNNEEATYLPHHPVVRTSALTTKLRVVFDGSCKTDNGKSLNDQQLVGPVVQDDLCSQLMRFRLHKVAINGDIAAMYRQIWIHPDHQDYQRILWRRKPEDPITSFRLKTVTYGTASAPWLATRCLNKIADEIQDLQPRAAEIIRSEFYVDDLLSGADTVEEATEIQAEVSQVLQSYGFPLRKWASNEPYVIDAIKGDSTQPAYLVNPESVVKTLGMKWDRDADTFSFKIKLKENQTLTKRSLLSEIASIFDPLGFAAPTIIKAKMLYQQVWLHGNGWDDPLPQDIKVQYEEFRTFLPALEEITVPRWVNSTKKTDLELHGFCDASEKAYAAVVYLKVKEGGKFSTNIMASKTRVAPLKTVSLPRLELLGAVLLVQLVEHVKTALKRPTIPVYCWSDSTITLAWINAEPSRFKSFVANRIAMIQESVAPGNWKHVISEENPADVASRGIMPHELKSHQLWFYGPYWLAQDYIPPPPPEEETTEEMRKIKTLHAHVKNESEFIERFSSFNKLLTFVAFILRCRCNFKRRKLDQSTVQGPFTVKERLAAFQSLCSYIQQQLLPKEFQVLSRLKKEESPDPQSKVERSMRKSKLFSLDPIFDQDSQLIRIGGRLQHSSLTYSQKHPIILPDCYFVRLYLLQLHQDMLHAGPTLLLATARQQVWIIGGKNAARQVFRNCTTCSRWRGQTFGQKMGNLPAARLQGLRAFHTVGIDYAGPITLKYRKGRGVPTHKGWICVFVCFTTKAVHLEAVSDMTSEAFIAALRRFVSRRGKPAHVHSDNGTNFVGADKELKLLFSQESQQQLAKGAADQGIQWHFIPPSAPHMGGLWEAAVKSAKFHLRRILKEALLSYEELSTVLCQIEACLNSRPLCPLTEDPHCEDALTPGHFLIGQPLNATPDPDLTTLRENSLSRWQYCQRLNQLFWQRWSNEYLSTLQSRNKWKTTQGDAIPGQLVVIKEDNQPPGKWKLAVITKVHPGKDERVRVVTVRTAQGEFQRPVVKLVPLFVDPLGQRGAACLEQEEEEDAA